MGLITNSRRQANDVIDLGNGNNMNGAVPNGFDVGLGLRRRKASGKTSPTSTSPVSSRLATPPTISRLTTSPTPLFGARMTSIGDPHGDRADCAKLTFFAPAAPDAIDDNFDIFEDGQDGLTIRPHARGVLFEVLANDTDADGDKLTITDVSGAQHGTLQIVDGDDADVLPEMPSLHARSRTMPVTTVSPTVSPTTTAAPISPMSMSTIKAVADIPDLDVQVLRGEEVNQIVLRVTATQTDADSSEFIDRIATSVAGGLPAGSTITPSFVNPSTEPEATQDFVVTLPQHEDANFDVTVTATSKETSNGDEESASQVVHIETNNTQTEIQATFLATDQSIWDTGNQFTFVDDRFLGVDTSWNESGGGFVFGHSDGSFKAGFQSTLTFEGGEIDAQAVYDISVETLYNKTTDVLHLSADALLDDASFTTEGPEGSYNLTLSSTSMRM